MGVDAPKSNLYDYEYSFALGAFLDNGEIIPPENIFKYGSPIMQVLEMQLEKIETGILTYDSIHKWGFKPCKDMTDTTLIADMLNPKKTPPNVSAYVKKNMLCLDFTQKEDMFVNSILALPPFRMLDFNIFPCMLPNFAGCATAAEMKRVTWKLALGRKISNPSNKKDPVSYSINFEDYLTNISKEINTKVNLMVNEIWDDDSDFGDKKLVAKFLTDTDRDLVQGYRNDLQLGCTAL
jgi:hypothetical protein